LAKPQIFKWQPVYAIGMEYWNIGILGVKAEINYLNFKNSFKPIIPLLHHFIIPIVSEAN